MEKKRRERTRGEGIENKKENEEKETEKKRVGREGSPRTAL